MERDYCRMESQQDEDPALTVSWDFCFVFTVRILHVCCRPRNPTMQQWQLEVLPPSWELSGAAAWLTPEAPPPSLAVCPSEGTR